MRVHEVSHQEHGYGYRNDTDEPQFPIERENQDDGRQRYQDGTGQVGHLVGQKRVGDTGIIVDDLTNLAAGIEVEESEGHADDLSHGFFPQVGFHPERRQMGAHQCQVV